MAGWYVSDSEVEDNEEKTCEHQDPNPSCIISLTLDAVFTSSKMIELLQRINREKCLQLECTNCGDTDNYLEERKHKRRKRKRKKRDSFPDGEVSETTSERISTHTASTGEYRDSRRPSLSAFDYEHEEFPALVGGATTTLSRRKRPCLTRKKEMCAVPLLATIEAQLKDEELNNTMNTEDGICDTPATTPAHRNHWSSMNSDPQEEKDTVIVSSPSHANGKKRSASQQQVVVANGHTIEDGAFNFSFDDDEDDDFDTPCDQEVSIFSKIRHIENFLDQD